MKHSISFFIILILLIPSFTTVHSLNTGPFPSYLEKSEIDIPIAIKFWGINVSSQTTLQTLLPATIIQESYYPESNRTFEWQINLESEFWGLQNNLIYTYESMTDIEFKNTQSSIFSASSSLTVPSPINSLETITGRSIPVMDIKNLFLSHQVENSYVLHIANFSALDVNSFPHWYSIGDTFSISSPLSDMRNLIDLGNRHILFDPTAIAPYFGFNQPGDFNTDVSIANISDSLINIIEELILGSPQSYNRIDLKENIVVNRVIFFSDPADIVFNRLGNARGYFNFKNEIASLFNGISIEQKEINSHLESVPKIEERITQNAITVGDERFLFIDTSEAEFFKTQIRSSYYDKFPSGWYYGLVFFAEEDLNIVYNITINGEKTIDFQEYNVGQIGFAAQSLKNWYQTSLSSLNQDWSSYMQLRLFGQNFGMSTYQSELVNQIEGPMSRYGVTATWNETFNQFDRDQFQRRYATTYRAYTEMNLEIIEEEYMDSIYFWVENEGYEDLKSVINQGNDELAKLNYSGAMELFINATKRIEVLSEPYERSQNFVRYGSLLMIFVILLFYYSDILIQSSITKEEFVNRLTRRGKKGNFD